MMKIQMRPLNTIMSLPSVTQPIVSRPFASILDLDSNPKPNT